jgi:NAD(P)-dependent dehydrogenase (short-subunit alcohol dehydrogenase family)
MISDFRHKTAVLTGAGSGFGLECARIGARMGMNLVLVDIQQDALNQAAAELQATGAPVLAIRVDVSRANEMEALGRAVQQHFGAPHFVFNNAGVGAGGLIWENSAQDWDWVLGVNLMGVVHGVRVFTPMMLEAADQDPAYQGHIVNTASMAGLLNAPNMGVYNASKHAVVSIGHRSNRCLGVVPVFCANWHQSESAQPSSRVHASRQPANAQPVDRSGHERQGGGIRQSECERGGAKSV